MSDEPALPEELRKLPFADNPRVAKALMQLNNLYPLYDLQTAAGVELGSLNPDRQVAGTEYYLNAIGQWWDRYQTHMQDSFHMFGDEAEAGKRRPMLVMARERREYASSSAELFRERGELLEGAERMLYKNASNGCRATDGNVYYGSRAESTTRRHMVRELFDAVGAAKGIEPPRQMAPEDLSV